MQLPKAALACRRNAAASAGTGGLLQPDKSAVALFSLLPFQIHLASGERRAAELCARWGRGSLCFWRGDLALIFVTDGVDSLSTERGGKKRQFLTGRRRPVPLVAEGCVAPQLR